MFDVSSSRNLGSKQGRNRIEGMAQVVEHLPSMYKALISNSTIVKK
jgi:hypothetical protein